MNRNKKLSAAEVGARIKEIRGGRTQEEFGLLIGVKHPTVYRYETDRIPDAETLTAIADLDPKKRGVEWILTGVSRYHEAGTHTDEPPRVREAEDDDPRKRALREMLDSIMSDDPEAIDLLERQFGYIHDAQAHRDLLRAKLTANSGREQKLLIKEMEKIERRQKAAEGGKDSKLGSEIKKGRSRKRTKGSD